MTIMVFASIALGVTDTVSAHDPYYSYPTYIIPEWSGVRMSEDNVKMINGSYTIHPNGEITFNRLTDVPVWYSMRVHKNGDVMFNGLVTIDYDEEHVMFNGQVVGHIFNDQIIWTHNLYLVSRGYPLIYKED